MNDFEAARLDLQKAIERFESARELERRARQLKSRLATGGQRLDRSAAPRDARFAARAARIGQRMAAADESARSNAETLKNAQQDLERARRAWEPFTDPRQAVARMSDDAPFLLLPVRLETRFRPVERSQDKELCVRIYPDDCSVDSFEQVPSDAEIGAMKRYWIAEWQAGRIVEQRRAAWRTLVSTYGAGRAEWLRNIYQPLNLAAMPAKNHPGDIVLVIVTDTAPSAADALAIQQYWRDVWIANGDRVAVENARSRLPSTLRARLPEIESNPPVNFAAEAASRARSTVQASTAFLVFKPDAEIDVQQQAWSRPPSVAAWPDRFVLLLYRRAGAEPRVELGNPIPHPLIVGLDPMAPAEEQLRHDREGNLIVPAAMKWMTDFDEAKRIGMAFAVRLSPPTPTFEKIVVIGVRANTDAARGAAELEKLITSHKNGARGFAIVPQGTPTNNSELGGSGFSQVEDADESFDRAVLAAPRVATNAADKTDGELLARWLGISTETTRDIPNAGGFDQAEAKAMNSVLWDATLGYWMGTLMHPVFDEDAIARTRRFFCEYVSGRGGIPAVRIGDQPYGILPITAFRRTQWMELLPTDATFPRLRERDYLSALKNILEKVARDWLPLADAVPRVGGPGDRAQNLLKVMGLHATSVTYAQRWVESFSTAFNRLTMARADALMSPTALSQLTENGSKLLRSFGYKGSDDPEILKQFHFRQHIDLTGPIVDVVPLSETDPLTAVTPDGKNYIEWLMAAARTSLEAVRAEAGFGTQQKPTALLYLLLRYAILEGYFNAGLRARESSGLIQRDEVSRLRKAAPIIHVKERSASESRYGVLTSPEPDITGSRTLRVGDFLTRQLGRLPATDTLNEQITALERLAKIPTARLERLFAEHIDCCNYRLDAWRSALVQRQLAHMRQAPPDGTKHRSGILLGAYGWLLNVAPRDQALTRVPLNDPGLRRSFGQGTVMRDSTNGGFIHAPSLNQAVAAAVLRSGFVANASPANRETCAVRLTSERVRIALGVLDGIRAGMSLGSILGKQFERGLHDRLADRLKYAFRDVFSLDQDKMQRTKRSPDRPAIKSRNVVDGLRLAEHLRQRMTNGQPLTYPFDLPLPADASGPERRAVEAEAARVLEAFDALADVQMAEGVYQAVNGNWARVTATLDAAAAAHLPSEPDVVRTPSTGSQLTHRVALHLDASISPTASAVTGVARTPMSTVDPALNDWLATILPSLGSIACRATYPSVAGTAVDRDVTLADLGLQPIDVIDALAGHQGNAIIGQALEDRILRFLQLSKEPPHPDARIVARDGVRDERAITVSYIETVARRVSIARATSLTRALRGLLSSARPLRASDLAPPTDASELPAIDAQAFVDRSRVDLVYADLNTVEQQMSAFTGALAPNVHKGNEDEAARARLVQRADQTMTEAYSLLLNASRFRVNRAGVRFLHDWKRKLAAWLRAEASAIDARWSTALAEHDSFMAAYASAPDDSARFDLLEKAERRVSPLATPRPISPATMRATVAAKRAPFEARRNQFRAFAASIPSTVAAQRSAFAALLPISRFDVVEPNLASFDDIVRVMSDEAYDAVTGIRSEIVKRLNDAKRALDDHDATVDATRRMDLLRKAARFLLSDDVMLIPEIAFDDDHSAELVNALGASSGGALLSYLQNTEKVDFPVDEWLYGCARVREPMRRWEQVVMLTGALGVAEPTLTPIQLPFKTGDCWLAGKFPPTYVIDGEKLLYTAHWRRPFATGRRQCGLLLDEWTEVIPARETKSGIAFHCDVPSSEPQQVMALVTPTAARGRWEWRDVLDGVNEMIDVAKIRLIEPSQIDGTQYSMFLPAVTTAATHADVTIAANIMRNNLRIGISQ